MFHCLTIKFQQSISLWKQIIKKRWQKILNLSCPFCYDFRNIFYILPKFRNSPGLCKSLPKDLVKNLELLQVDNSIILFGWSVFRASFEDSDEAMNYCNMVTCELIKKNVFGTLLDLIMNSMFKVICNFSFKIFTKCIHFFFDLELCCWWYHCRCNF